MATPSLKDIASELNVSPSLVSKVLNDRLGNSGARPDTIRAIRQKADELGYRKNVSAVALRAGRHQTIGVFVHRLGRSGTGLIEALLEGITEEAQQSQYRLTMAFFHTAEQFRKLRPGIHSGTVDGVIMGGLAHPDLAEDLHHFRRVGVPSVSIHDRSITPLTPNIGISQIEVGRVATAHLIERGCRRIGHVYQTPERYDGYVRALQHADLPLDPDLVYRAQGVEAFAAAGAELAVRHWLDQGIAFDGIFASSDEQAAGALNELHRRGVRVPEQVRVVGVDDASYCRFTIVPLTSVNQQYHERGREAVRRLLAQDADDAEPPASIEFAPVLKPRASTA